MKKLIKAGVLAVSIILISLTKSNAYLLEHGYCKIKNSTFTISFSPKYGFEKCYKIKSGLEKNLKQLSGELKILSYYKNYYSGNQYRENLYLQKSNKYKILKNLYNSMLSTLKIFENKIFVILKPRIKKILEELNSKIKKLLLSIDRNTLSEREKYKLLKIAKLISYIHVNETKNLDQLIIEIKKIIYLKFLINEIVNLHKLK